MGSCDDMKCGGKGSTHSWHRDTQDPERDHDLPLTPRLQHPERVHAPLNRPRCCRSNPASCVEHNEAVAASTITATLYTPALHRMQWSRH
eukprot:gene9297-biopygen4260